MDEDDGSVVIPALLFPAGGTPHVIDTEIAFARALEELSHGTGAFAVDAERASGYKYSQRAYLIQIKRH
ncbi:MAG: ribonuclease D, partial [Actinobacteria bacterium]|nr:ribonuclease D [Actinomycetota bacterium]